MEDAEFDGRSTRVEKTTFQRLVAAAEHHHHRRGRPVFPGLPEQTISDWLDDLELARTGPTPTPEPGDLLVKLKRGEHWTLTPAGWRELVPVELQPGDKTDDRMNVTGGGYCGKHGVFQGTRGCPGCAAAEPPCQPQPRFFGRSVIEDEFDRIDLHKQAHVAAAELLAVARRQAEDELENDVVEALTDWLAHRNNQRGDT